MEASLEDKVYELTAENTALKKQRHSQDEKMKRLATKILRLKSDMKKLQVGKPTKYTNDVEVVEDLKMKVSQLEGEISTLKQKLLLAKNLTPDQNKSKSQKGYSFVEPRIDTGLPYKQGGVVTPGRKTPARQQKPPQFPQYGQSVLNNAKMEIEQLDEIVDQLKYQLQVVEDEKQDLLNRQQDLELGYENKLLALREQLLQHQRTGISEDIDIINLQRKIKDYKDQLGDGDTKVLKIRNELSTSKRERDRAEEEVSELRGQIEKLNAQLRATHNRAENSLLQSNQANEMSVALEEVEREREILKQENSRLIEDVFDIEKEKNYKQNERKLRDRVKQLEHRLERLQSTTQDAVPEHDEVFDKFLTERDKASELEHRVNKLEMTNRELEMQLDRTRELLEEEEKIRIREREERIAEDQESVTRDTVTRDVVTNVVTREIPVQSSKALQLDVESLVGEDPASELRELQSEHANLVMELEKTNMLLDIQYKLKQDYQDEVSGLTGKYERVRREFARREDEAAKLLDIRNHTINKLELQLRDIAYGTKMVKIEPTSDSDSPADYNINLERGQNVMEIHIGKLYLSQDHLLNPDEKLFVVLNFYHFETVISKVVGGLQPDFNTTSQNIVNVDDFFLKSLQSESAGVYLYSCNGVEFRCIGACQLFFKEIINQPSNSRVHGSLQILGTSGEINGVVFANLEYYTRLKFPITHSLTLFKERMKANTYLNNNNQPDAASDGVARDNYNELKITVLNCSQLKSSSNSQPSPYVMYKFYTFEDHDTAIIDSTNSPQYNDTMSYPVSTDGHLHRYLTQGVCHIYVFDDSEQPDSLLGVVEVPLLPLAHGNNISGVFEISNKTLGGGVVGVMSLKLEWQMSYLPPSAQPDILTPDQTDRRYAACDLDTEPQSLLPEHYEQISREQDEKRRAEERRREDEEERRREAAQRREEEEQRRAKEEGVKEEELIKEQSKPALQHVTFKIEEAELREEQEVTTVEAHQTEFLSFRSVEEYERAVKKTKEESSGSTISEISSVDEPPKTLVTQGDHIAQAIISDEISEEISDEISEEMEELAGLASSSDNDQETSQKAAGDAQSAQEKEESSAPEKKSQVSRLKKLQQSVLDDSSDEDDIVLGTFEVRSTTPVPSPRPPSYMDLSDDEPDIVETELEPTSAAQLNQATPFDTTFFEEEPSEEDSLEIGNSANNAGLDEDETLEQVTERMMSSDDDEMVVMTTRDFTATRDMSMSRTADSLDLGETVSSTPDPTPRPPPLVVIIHYLSFRPDAFFVVEAEIGQVFVEYKLLNVDPADTETPGSVKVTPDTKLNFNFRKTFYIEKETEDWRMLKDIVNNSAEKKITFTVVSDPGDDTDAECNNLCRATVDLPVLEDITEEELPLFGARDGNQVGVLCVTIETMSAIRALT